MTRQKETPLQALKQTEKVASAETPAQNKETQNVQTTAQAKEVQAAKASAQDPAIPAPDGQGMARSLVELARLDSVSYHEARVAACLKQELKALGFEVTEDAAGAHYESECGNLYGILPGDPNLQPILLSAHMDTVEPGLGKIPMLQAGRITSDGTTVLGADDLCGILEILEGIRLAKAGGLPIGDIEVLFTIAEETYGKGAKAFDYSRIRARQGYVLDMSGPVGSAARKAPSIIAFEAEIRGRAAHAGFAPEKGINALQAAARAIARIPQGKISEDLTLNIGTIEGGTADNIVAEDCRCTGEVRGFDHQEALAKVKEAESIFRAEAESIGAQLTFRQTVHIQAYETPEDAPVCRRFQQACHTLGLPGDLKSTHGGSDNNVFARHGIQGIVLSCGMYNTHSTREYTTIGDLEQGAQLVAAILTQQGKENDR